MKLRFLSLTPLLLSAMLFTGCAGSKPIVGEHISPKGTTNFKRPAQKFELYLPSVPTEKLSFEKTEAGTLETTTYQTEKSNIIYIVLVIKLPPNADMTKDSDNSLSELQSSFVSSSKGTLVSHRSLNLDGIAGREIIVSNEGDFLTRVMAYATADYCYQVMAIGHKTDIEGKKAEVDKVLDSFRRLP